MKKFVGLFLCLAMLLLSAGCVNTRTERYQAQFLELFDTVTTVIGYSDSEADFKEFAERLRSMVQEYHQLYDIYHTYEGINNIKTVNDHAGKAPVTVDRRIIHMLKFAKEEYAATNGLVNVAMGAVLSIWHTYREDGQYDPENAQLPPMDQLRAASRHTNIDDVIIDEHASTVYLNDPEMRLDVGAVAKGYATEEVARYFEGQGVKSLLISIGGNVRAIGEKLVPDSNGERRWNIGVQNPDKENPQSELMNVLISGLSVVSSGISERYYTVDGVPYHHIIDPTTLMPSAYFAQLTILCRDSGLGDVLSTAVFNMPLEQGRTYIESLGTVEAVWVMKDGSLEYSSGFKKYVKQ